MNSQHQQQFYQGIFIFVLGYLFLAFASAAVKLLGHSVSISVILFIQSLIGLLLTFPAIIRFGFKHLSTTKLKFHLARDLGGLAWFLAFFLSVRDIPLSNATLLSNTTPIWLPILSWLWLKTKIRKDLGWGIALGFVGIVLILRPAGHNFLNIGSLFALASGVIAAFTLLAVRELSQTEPKTRILFYYYLVMTLATLPFAIKYWVVLSLQQWLLLGGIGVFVWLEQYYLSLSFKFAKPSSLAPFSYSRIVFAAILDWIIWKHVPELLTLVGIAFVMVGGIITLLKEQNVNKALAVSSGAMVSDS